MAIPRLTIPEMSKRTSITLGILTEGTLAGALYGTPIGSFFFSATLIDGAVKGGLIGLNISIVVAIAYNFFPERFSFLDPQEPAVQATRRQRSDSVGSVGEGPPDFAGPPKSRTMTQLEGAGAPVQAGPRPPEPYQSPPMASPPVDIAELIGTIAGGACVGILIGWGLSVWFVSQALIEDLAVGAFLGATLSFIAALMKVDLAAKPHFREGGIVIRDRPAQIGQICEFPVVVENREGVVFLNCSEDLSRFEAILKSSLTIGIEHHLIMAEDVSFTVKENPMTKEIYAFCLLVDGVPRVLFVADTDLAGAQEAFLSRVFSAFKSEEAFEMKSAPGLSEIPSQLLGRLHWKDEANHVGIWRKSRVEELHMRYRDSEIQVHEDDWIPSQELFAMAGKDLLAEVENQLADAGELQCMVARNPQGNIAGFVILVDSVPLIIHFLNGHKACLQALLKEVDKIAIFPENYNPKEVGPVDDFVWKGSEIKQAIQQLPVEADIPGSIKGKEAAE